MDNQKHDWKILVYDDVGHVIINTTMTQRTEEEMQAWRTANETERWSCANIDKVLKPTR